MRRILLVLVALAAVAAGAAAAGSQQSFPETIRLPDGFQPEGIAISGRTFYVGSIPTGAIVRGDLRTGRSSVLVPGAATGKAAIGIEVHGGRLYVAGGPTGKAFVYDARTGAAVATHQLTTAASTFINDVSILNNAAWFTDSLNQVVYRVELRRGGGRPGPEVQTIPLTGAIQYTTGFNANGIVAAPGRRLIVVQSNVGKLFTVTQGGVTREISLGGATVANGDGLLLQGRTLYVVQNRDNKIAKVALDGRITSGRIVRYLTDPDLDVPTTIDDFGRRLYAVNGRFTTTPTPTTRYDIVQLRKR
jgi:sugar lactone lactonase YvrE